MIFTQRDFNDHNMSLGHILDKDLIANLAVFISSRNWKNAKALAKGISQFRLDDEEGTFVSSGWPIGKVESEDHFRQCCRKGKDKKKFYNISTGLLKKGGMPSYVYGDGWCVPRGSPEHIALEKVIEIKEPQYEIDMTDDGWPILKDTFFIWDCDKDCVVGLYDNGKGYPIIDNEIDYLKSNNIPYRAQLDMNEIKRVRL